MEMHLLCTYVHFLSFAISTRRCDENQPQQHDDDERKLSRFTYLSQVYALLGVNTASPREARGKTDLQGTVVAIDIPLDRNKQDATVVWERELQTNGLINAIALPYLAPPDA